MNPIYSICMCNHNMADTLELSLGSLLPQLDDRFEVVLVDDASTDTSVEVVRRLQRDAPSLRLVTLPSNRRRKLGTTWNVGVRKAKGKYVLLHLDCDDVFGPHVVDFVEVFHRIEACLDRDLVVCGRHVHMGRRQLLLNYGPYRNIHRGQDRDMRQRLAVDDALLVLDHVDFIRRLPKNKSTRTKKAILDTFSHVRENFRVGWSVPEIVGYCLGHYINGLNGWQKRSLQNREHSLRLRLFKIAVLLPAWLMALRDGPISPVNVPKDYLKRMRGTYAEIMRRHGGDPALSFLSEEAQRIFASTD